MRKKTFKIFVNSFVISLFTMWSVNELFAVPQYKNNEKITIPEKNIALFFKDEAPTVNFSSTTPVSSFSLSAPAPKPAEKDIFIDEDLFVFDDEENDDGGFRISSVEDAADLPLESSAPSSQKVNSEDDTPSETILSSVSRSAPLFSAPSREEMGDNGKEVSVRAESGEEETSVYAHNAQTEVAPSAADDAENIIPLEFGSGQGKEKNVVIAEKAPENQIAMADGGHIDIESVSARETTHEEKNAPTEWYEMKDVHPEASPWVVAKGTRNPRNNQVLDEDFYKGMNESDIAAILDKPKPMAKEEEEVQVAEMVKNILIPIPEDILNDENLTPQLVSPKKNAQNKAKTESATDAENTVAEGEKSGGLLKSIASIFSGSDDGAGSEENGEAGEDDESEQPRKRRGLFSVFGKDKAPTKILPAEMRLSFQPGRAEISGTTLRWIEAFANKVKKDSSVILEIRIDRTSSFDLQQRRLNLLHNILTNKGVEYGKINTVFTSREPNSFIIRTLRINENVNNDVQKDNNGRNLYYQSW